MIRVSFVKLLPRRFVPDSEIVSIGSNQYTTTFINIEPEAVYQDQGDIEPVSLTFSWDGSTCTFTTASAPDENIFLDYPLYFCTSTTAYVQDDPATPSGSVVEWLPNLIEHPSVPESSANMLNGVLSTSSLGIRLTNADYALNQYFTKYDNYKNKPAFIYGRLGDNYRKLGYGYITRIATGSNISISIKTTNKLLEADATLGNREQHYLYTSAKWPNIDKGYEGKPIPVQYGPLSQHHGSATREIRVVYDVTTPTFNYSVPNDRIKLKCPYVGSDKWFVGICDDPISRTSWESAGVTYINSTQYQLDDLEYLPFLVQGSTYRFGDVADTVQKDDPLIAIDYATGILTVSSASVNIEIFYLTPASIWILRKPSSTATTEYLEKLNDLAYLSVPNFANPTPPLTWEFELTDSGQYMVYFVMDPAYTNYADFIGRPFYAVLHSNQITQTDFIQKYIESIGIDVDTTSFSQAQTDANTNVMITANKDHKLDTVHKLVEAITTSCNGLLHHDSETNKYKYKIINSSLSGTDHTISSTDILEPDLVPKVEYQDVVATVTMNHPYTIDNPYTEGSSLSEISSFSRALNSEGKSKTIEHYLTDVTDVIGYKSETYNTPMITYEFTLMADDFFGIDIGDIVQIENVNGRLLSIGTSIRLVVIARTRSVEKIGIKAYDFSKIP